MDERYRNLVQHLAVRSVHPSDTHTESAAEILSLALMIVRLELSITIFTNAH